MATGPFVAVVKVRATVYELGRNPSTGSRVSPAWTCSECRSYRSNAEIVKALVANEVDWASLFFPDIEKEWVAADPAHHQYWYPDTGPTVLLFFDTRRKPFDDRNVRKALSMAIDRARITKDALNGYAPPADATGLAESQKRWKDPALARDPSTQRNVAEANKLLDAAGLARGADGIRMAGTEPMRYTFQTVQGWTDWLAAVEILRQNLAEVGVAVTVKTVEYNAWDDALKRGPFRDEHGLRQPRAHALRVLPGTDGWRARAADRRKGGSELPSLRGPGGGEGPAQVRGDLRCRGDGGPGHRASAAVRLRRAQHSAFHRPAMGRATTRPG